MPLPKASGKALPATMDPRRFPSAQLKGIDPVNLILDNTPLAPLINPNNDEGDVRAERAQFRNLESDLFCWH